MNQTNFSLKTVQMCLQDNITSLLTPEEMTDVSKEFDSFDMNKGKPGVTDISAHTRLSVCIWSVKYLALKLSGSWRNSYLFVSRIALHCITCNWEAETLFYGDLIP